jgi:hypothetical protein
VQVEPPRRAPRPAPAQLPAPIAAGAQPRARHAELWDDGEGELWVDGPPAPRAARRSSAAPGIFDVEAPAASVVEHAA